MFKEYHHKLARSNSQDSHNPPSTHPPPSTFVYMNLYLPFIIVVSPIPPVYKDRLRLPGYPLNLIQSFFQGASIIRISMEGFRSYEPTSLARDRYGYFTPKFVFLVRFALGYACHLRGMNAVKPCSCRFFPVRKSWC